MPSGRGRGRDPELVAANKRRQRALARDIGNEQALARDDQPRYRRPTIWLLVFIVLLAVAGGIQTLRHHGGGPPIARNCTRPALALEAGSVTPHGRLDWSATGPASGRYVLALNGTPTGSADSGTVAVRGGQALSPVFQMTDCIVHSTFVAPDAIGTYQIRLFRRVGPDYTLVSQGPLTVAGS
jgi:hypothetical protein